MAIKAQLTGSGAAGGLAVAITGVPDTTVSGAGTTHSDCTLLPLKPIIWVKTAANNSGVIIPPGNGSGDGMTPGDSMWVYIGDSNTLLLYPPLLGTLNDGTATTGTVSIPTKTSVEIICLSSTNYLVSGPTT